MMNMMLSMLLFSGVISAPRYEYDSESEYYIMEDVIERNVDVIIIEPEECFHDSTKNCTQCKDVVNRMKNETGTLIKIVNDIDLVCQKIYGPAAKECVNVTNILKKDLQHLEKTNSTALCKQWHYC